MAAGAGVHVDQAERGVAHHFQDVGVAADEQTGQQGAEVAGCPFVVIARITSDGSCIRLSHRNPSADLRATRLEFRRRRRCHKLRGAA